MNRPLRPMFAIAATAIAAHLALAFVVSRLQPRPEDMRRTLHAEFESIAEEGMAIRVALEIERMSKGGIDEIILGKYLRQIVRENLGMTLKAEGWEMIRVEQGFDSVMTAEGGAGGAWTGYSDVRRERKRYTVTIRKGGASRGEVVKVEEAKR